MKAGVGRAPGKVILVGEHAVVHGQPAVAMPFPAVQAEAVATPTAGPLVVTSEQAGADTAGLWAAAAAALAAFGRDASGLSIQLRSTIPLGRGLGSSAATAVAVVRAVAAACGAQPSVFEVAALADAAERHAHGTPSGLDAATIAAGMPILFRRPPGEAAKFGPIAAAFAPVIVVADTGVVRDTRAAVAAVAAKLAADEAAAVLLLGAFGVAASRAVEGLRTGEPKRLAEAMNATQAMLADLGVSTPAIDALAQAARAAGALAAKLTGAGRGGCVVALAPDAAAVPAIAAAMRAAGAVQIIGGEQAA